MRVAVVVTVRDEEATVGALMEALASQTRPPDQIVVVDGGSTDATWDLLQRWASRLPSLHVLRRPGADIARGRNEGVMAAQAEAIAVTDAGCIPSPRWLEFLVAPLEADAQVGLVLGAVIPHGGPFEQTVGWCSITPDLRIGNLRANPTARSLAFRKAIWAEAGGFPTQPPFNRAEDGVFIRRAALSTRVAAAPQATVAWTPRGTYRAVLRQFYQYARGVALLGETASFHTRTIATSAASVALAIWACATGSALPCTLLVALAGLYLARKAKAGCFRPASWHTLYRVPLILATIHVGTMAGIAVGTCRRLSHRP